MAKGKSTSGDMNWPIIVLLAASWATVYMMPYARSFYYDALMDGLKVTNTQLGYITSFFGILSLVCYFPGGWLAERFSTKKMLMLSFFATTLLGFWYSRLTSFETVIVIHLLFGVFGNLTFWAAYIKATRLCAPPEAQSRAFGFVEGLGRFISMGIVLAGAWIMGRYASDQQVEGVKAVLVFYSICCGLVGLGIAFFMKDEVASNQIKNRITLADIIRVAKISEVWLIAAIIFMAYTSYRCHDVMTPYSTNLCGLTGAMGAIVASLRNYGMGFGAIAGGLMGDRLGTSRTMIIGFLTVIISSLLILVFPGTPSTLWFFVTLMLTFMLAHYAMRGLYYALLSEGLVPVHLTGLATGIIATIGYAPDIFSPLFQGALLDIFGKNSYTGYNYIFVVSIMAAVIGIILCQIFNKRVKRKLEMMSAG